MAIPTMNKKKIQKNKFGSEDDKFSLRYVDFEMC